MSNRELQIVRLAAEGLTDKEIALRLGIAMGSVRTYWERMRHKLDAKNRAELMARVLSNGNGLGPQEKHSAASVLRAIIDNSGVAMAVVDEKGEFRHMNPAMSRLLKEMRSKETNFVSAFLGGSRFSFLQMLSSASSVRSVPIRTSGGLKMYHERVVQITLEEERLLLVNLVETSFRTVGSNAIGLSNAISAVPAPLCVVSRNGTILASSLSFSKRIGADAYEYIGQKIWNVLGTPETEKIQLDLNSAVGRDSLKSRWTVKAGEQGVQEVQVDIFNKLQDPMVRALWVWFSDDGQGESRPDLQEAYLR